MTAEGDRVARAVRGDADALSALAAEHRPVARRTALALLGDPEAAEDIAQEAMIRLQAALPGFRGDAELGTWLHRVTTNLVYDHLRRSRRRRYEVPLREARSQPDPHRPDPARAVDSDRARAALSRAMDELPPEQKEVLVLRFLSQLSYAEIAEVTGMAPGTVASRIFRGLERLGSHLEPKHLEILR